MGKSSFGNGSKRISAFDLRAGFGFRAKLPHAFLGKSVKVYSPFKEITGLLRQFRQRVLESVKHLPQKAGSQFYREHVPGKVNHIVDADSLGHFKNLELADITPDADDLTLEFLSAYFHITNFVHGNIAVKTNTYHVTVDSNYCTFCSGHFGSPDSFIIELASP